MKKTAFVLAAALMLGGCGGMGDLGAKTVTACYKRLFTQR